MLSELENFEQWQLERELNLLNVDVELLWRPWTTLSGGEQTKCLLAVLFLDEAHFPLLDEPTNHLDLPSRQLVADYLQKKSGFIVVSHDRDFLNAVTDHTLAIERAKIELYSGNFAVYEAEKAREDNLEQTKNDKLKGEISRLKESSRDKSDWSKRREGDIHGDPHIKGSGGTGHNGTITARAARVMKRSKSLENRMQTQISEKEKLLKNLEKVDKLEINCLSNPNKILVRADKIQLSYGGKALFQPISFELEQGKILALTGPNGIGKSSLIQALQGQFTGRVTGELKLASQVKISKVRQLLQNEGSLKAFSVQRGLDYEEFLNNLRKLGMPRAAFDRTIETLSQGQQKEVELAASLSEKATLYLWDEPLNFLDVYNHEQLAELLQRAKPTMLLVSHDAQFIRQVASEIIELVPAKS